MAKNWMMDHSAQAIRVKVDDLTRFVVDALTSLGMSREDAETTANVLVTTDARGVSVARHQIAAGLCPPAARRRT